MSCPSSYTEEGILPVNLCDNTSQGLSTGTSTSTWVQVFDCGGETKALRMSNAWSIQISATRAKLDIHKKVPHHCILSNSITTLEPKRQKDSGKKQISKGSSDIILLEPAKGQFRKRPFSGMAKCEGSDLPKHQFPAHRHIGL